MKRRGKRHVKKECIVVAKRETVRGRCGKIFKVGKETEEGRQEKEGEFLRENNEEKE